MCDQASNACCDRRELSIKNRTVVDRCELEPTSHTWQVRNANSQPHRSSTSFNLNHIDHSATAPPPALPDRPHHPPLSRDSRPSPVRRIHRAPFPLRLAQHVHPRIIHLARRPHFLEPTIRRGAHPTRSTSEERTYHMKIDRVSVDSSCKADVRTAYRANKSTRRASAGKLCYKPGFIHVPIKFQCTFVRAGASWSCSMSFTSLKVFLHASSLSTPPKRIS